MTVTRFAPSPTGYMHIGNLRTALYSYLIGKHDGGKFILRIEDTDRERLVEGATDVIKSTLAMTGLNYDEGPDVGGANGPYVQSERKEIYMEYAKKLVELGHAYYCFCTKERLEKLHEEDAMGGYDRHCRNLSKAEVEKNLEAVICMTHVYKLLGVFEIYWFSFALYVGAVFSTNVGTFIVMKTGDVESGFNDVGSALNKALAVSILYPKYKLSVLVLGYKIGIKSCAEVSYMHITRGTRCKSCYYHFVLFSLFENFTVYFNIKFNFSQSYCQKKFDIIVYYDV